MSILEQLKELSESDLMSCYNQYAQNNNYEEVYNNDEEFFEIFYPSAIDAVRAVCFGEYEYSHKFVMLNGYANLESSNYLEDLIDLDDLASYIEDNISDFSGWIEEEEEEEEEIEEEETNEDE